MAGHTSRILAIAAATYVVYLVVKRLIKPKRRYPPGPRGLPFIGSLLDIDNERPWITYSEMAKKYGNIVMFRVMGKPIILLGAMEHAHALLQKRMMNYGDRPELVVAQELVTQNGWYVGTSRMHHNTHQKHRKILAERLRANALSSWAHPAVEPEEHLLMQRLAQCPEHFVQSFKTFTVNVMINTTFAHGSVESVDDPLVERINLATDHQFVAQIQGRFWVDYFPPLKYLPLWLPGMGWKRKGLEWREEVDTLYQELWDKTIRQNEGDNEGPNCLTKTLIQKEMHHMKELEGITMGASIVDAGTETLTATSVVIIIVFMYFPHVLTKAQQIVDETIGRNRMPTFADLGRMPYITALIREAFRWRTVAPLAIPHAVVKDDIYAGYDIPKGATVYALSQYIHEDEDLYPNHESFRPERFLGEDGQLNNLPHAGFGFGSRKCLGTHFAEQTLYLVVSSLVWSFDISAPVDPGGEKVLPSLDPKDWGAFLASPPPMDFKVNITPRSHDVVKIIDQTVAMDAGA